MRTYLALPVRVTLSTPPSPPVTEATSVQGPPAAAEPWILYALPYAASQVSTARVRVTVDPRSTWSHWSLVARLDQRVPVEPSTALPATNPPSTEEEVAG